MVEKILFIKAHNPHTNIETTLIRLMPVGKLSNIPKSKYKSYNPIQTIYKICEAFSRNNIDYKLHCSLRVLPALSHIGNSIENCAMLQRKIGIDCAGNVFACAWGAYVQINGQISQNPFYLGNLLQTDLLSILEGVGSTNAYKKITNEISAKTERHYCSVVSYFHDEKIFEGTDYLAIIPKSK